MARFLKDRSAKRGSAPGSLVTIAESQFEGMKVRLTNYDAESLEEKFVDTIEDCRPDSENKNNVSWIDIEGFADKKAIRQVGKLFGIHRLWLEDVLNTDHRPKVEELNDLLFVIVKSPIEVRKRIKFEQISLFLGDGFVISFQERVGDTFESVRNRLRQSKWIIRKAGADYLFYALIDTVVDNYYFVLESLGKQIEALDGSLESGIPEDLPRKINHYKNELLYLNKACKPVRDALAHICRATTEGVDEATLMYFKDAHEHTIQIVDTIESYKQMLSSLMDAYHGIVNQKMNEIMKVLTIFSTIFIPLTFVAGVYGMNFRHMPELEWEHGYLFAWLLMGTIGAGLFLFIKRRKWL